ncbi:60S ribosomal protein L24 [Thecamonas trahens ATCC 50062]|uniref:60S ribosomal protein L24 n=1 Tax=Thecamonas trahens ATCC 50062 TaxID=461836 RepID=A0A0L0DVT5_THETB|nr:60S ribosomal protein L24 [Thecamonas trahens ATCC 50062]KNC56292.1 60S ribosomal protein L24 [Thecamonas trahens ATCC 50062]|eukprot:XP_013760811.1 60S ribosomal protein L24 [Thecamonas trahens ATCC 50062]
MKVETCAFSGHKIYPGKGMTFIRSDARLFKFGSRKARAHYNMRHNPRKMAWTQVFRRMHKKGNLSSFKAKKSRRVVKFQRGFVGASLAEIREKVQAQRDLRAVKKQAVAKAKGASAKPTKAERRAAKKAKRAEKAAKTVKAGRPNLGGR